MSILDAGGSPSGSLLDQAPPPNPRRSLAGDLSGLERNVEKGIRGAGSWLARGTASNASTLSRALDYQRARTQEAMFHQGSSDKNRTALRKRLGLEDSYQDPRLFGAIPIPEGVQHFLRGTEDFALDTITDPLTYETLGLGPIAKGVGGLANRLARFGARVAPEASKTVRSASNLAREHFSLGGRNAELLRRSHGQGAKDNVLGAMTHSDAEGHHVQTLLNNRIQSAFKGLSKPQQSEALRILNGELPMPRTGPVADAAKAVRKTTDDQLYLQLTSGSRGLFPLARKGVRTNVTVKNAPQKSAFEDFMGDAGKLPPGRIINARVGNLPRQQYDLPQNLREFATVPGEATLKNFRRRYVSGLVPAEEGASHGSFTANPLNFQNPNLLNRQDMRINAEDPGQYIDALGRSAANAGKAISSARLYDRMRKVFGENIPLEAVQALEKTFHGAGENRTDKERVLDAIRGVTGYGKAAITQLSPLHAANVGALSLLHNPTGTGKVLKTAAQLLKNRSNPEKTYELLRPGIERGAIGPAKEHGLYFEKVPLLGQWSKLMSDITWGVDNAAKTEYAKKLGNGYSAGRRASEDLIDYRYPSDFARNELSLLSRFPTYRSQLLPSVAKGVAKNPARAAALMRASGGALTGDEINVNGRKVKSYTSVADAGRALGDPHGFVRSTLGDPQKAALSLLGVGHGRNPRYFTYGKPVDAKYVLNAAAAGLPEGRSILDSAGFGLFPKKSVGDNLLFNFTGIGIK